MMDWKTLLKELKDAGQTQVLIAARCGVSQSSVSELSRGDIKSPSFDFGTKLLQMHAELIGAEPAPSDQRAAA